MRTTAYKAYRDERRFAKVDETEREYRAFLQLVRSLPNKSDIARARATSTACGNSMHSRHRRSTQRTGIADCSVFLHHYPCSGIFSEQDAENSRSC